MMMIIIIIIKFGDVVGVYTGFRKKRWEFGHMHAFAMVQPQQLRAMEKLAHIYSHTQPAKWLCDASSVLVGVWLLITLRFQPSPLASKLLAAPRKGEQSVSLSLPVHSLSTASPMQCLLAAAGVYGCRKAPEPNCKGEISMTQQ